MGPSGGGLMSLLHQPVVIFKGPPAPSPMGRDPSRPRSARASFKPQHRDSTDLVRSYRLSSPISQATDAGSEAEAQGA